MFCFSFFHPNAWIGTNQRLNAFEKLISAEKLPPSKPMSEECLPL
jgi:hypothetical protein